MTEAQAFAQIESALSSLPSIAAREAGSAELAGERAPYADIMARLSHLIGEAKVIHAQIGALASHSHDWNDDDYCVICGADGRA